MNKTDDDARELLRGFLAEQGFVACMPPWLRPKCQHDWPSYQDRVEMGDTEVL